MMLKGTLVPVVASVALSSCGVAHKSAQFVRNTSDRAVELVNPTKIRVVEVRDKDLKKMPTGQERVLAFENSHKRSFWDRAFGGPVDFIEPTLPASGGELDGSLLPPKEQ